MKVQKYFKKVINKSMKYIFEFLLYYSVRTQLILKFSSIKHKNTLSIMQFNIFKI